MMSSRKTTPIDSKPTPNPILTIQPLPEHTHTCIYTIQSPKTLTETHTIITTSKRVHTKSTTHTQIHKPKISLVLTSNKTPTHMGSPKNATHTTMDHTIPNSPKSRVRVRVSFEFEREGEAMDALREKPRGRRRKSS